MAHAYNPSLEFDDFLTPGLLGETHSEFGRKGAFWVKYDKLANKFDQDMMARLNNNLDVLLIFAALFSAVNTAFIVGALSMLSTNPVSQSDTLLQLIVLNLQSYERTGQTGRLDEQGMARTAKFICAETWGLQMVVEALPTLPLISPALFITALTDYLFSINRSVALAVLAFTIAGTAFYVFTVVAAAASITCPFQTAISAGIRKLFIRAREVIYSDYIPLQFLRSIIKPPGQPQASRNDELFVRSIIWMIQTAPSCDNLIAVAQYIPYIPEPNAVRLIASSSAFTLFLGHFRSTLVAARNEESSGAVATAITMSRAMAHVVLTDPERAWMGVWGALEGAGLYCSNDGSWPTSDELWILLVSILGVCELYGEIKETLVSELALLCGTPCISLHERIRNVGSAAASIYTQSRVLAIRHDCLTIESLIDEISEIFLPEDQSGDSCRINYASHALSVATWPWASIRPGEESSRIEHRKPVWFAPQSDVASNLLQLLCILSSYCASVLSHWCPIPMHEQVLQCHNLLLARVSELQPSIELILEYSQLPTASLFLGFHSALNENLRNLIILDRQASTSSPEALDRCRDAVVQSIECLLLTSVSPGQEAERRAMATTVSFVPLLEDETERETLLRGVLYRRALYAQRSKCSSSQSQSPLNIGDRTVAPLLLSSARLHRWLHTSNAGSDEWHDFDAFLHFITTGDVTAPQQPGPVGMEDLCRATDPS
ncbi:hypothetical protein FRB98_003905 [Tulasnella sp. 332]|nr:hypothetical protein FRB98_003905 [Tulasnella sp. 332]